MYEISVKIGFYADFSSSLSLLTAIKSHEKVDKYEANISIIYSINK